jgi:adenylate cyclase
MIKLGNAWAPIRFPPEEEAAFAERMAARIIPLLQLASTFGFLAFGGYQLWDLLLDPEALGKTGPIRLLVMAWFVCGIFILKAPVFRRKPHLLPLLGLLTYSVVAIGFGLVVAQLPGGFVAGVGGFIIGMIFIPLFVYKFSQAAIIVLPLVVIPLATMALTSPLTKSVLDELGEV